VARGVREAVAEGESRGARPRVAAEEPDAGAGAGEGGGRIGGLGPLLEEGARPGLEVDLVAAAAGVGVGAHCALCAGGEEAAAFHGGPDVGGAVGDAIGRCMPQLKLVVIIIVGYAQSAPAVVVVVEVVDARHAQHLGPSRHHVVAGAGVDIISLVVGIGIGPRVGDGVVVAREAHERVARGAAAGAVAVRREIGLEERRAPLGEGHVDGAGARVGGSAPYLNLLEAEGAQRIARGRRGVRDDGRLHGHGSHDRMRRGMGG